MPNGSNAFQISYLLLTQSALLLIPNQQEFPLNHTQARKKNPSTSRTEDPISQISNKHESLSQSRNVAPPILSNHFLTRRWNPPLLQRPPLHHLPLHRLLPPRPPHLRLHLRFLHPAASKRRVFRLPFRRRGARDFIGDGVAEGWQRSTETGG